MTARDDEMLRWLDEEVPEYIGPLLGRDAARRIRELLARAEKAETIVRDIANSGCECAQAALCDLCDKPLVDCKGGLL